MDEFLDVSDREGRRKEPSQGSPRRRRGFFGFLAGLLGGEGDEGASKGRTGIRAAWSPSGNQTAGTRGAPIAVATRTAASIGTEVAAGVPGRLSSIAIPTCFEVDDGFDWD